MLQLIEILTRLLFLFLFGTGVVMRPGDPPPTPVEAFAEPMQSMTNISEVEVIVLESDPMHVQLQVRGEHPDGCELPVIVEQSRAGNTVNVRIYRELPTDVFCPMMLQPYDDTIMLDGSFEPGDYVFQVNDFVLESTL